MKIYVNGVDFRKTEFYGKRILLDTMILCYAHDALSPYREEAKLIILAGLNNFYEPYISIQNIFEFYSVITSKRVHKPLSPQEASKIALTYFTSRKIKKLYPENVSEALKYASNHDVKGGDVFDILLAFTAKNQVDYIWTENTSNFKGIRFVKIVNPFNFKWEIC